MLDLAEGLSDKGYMMYEKKGGRTTGHASSGWGQIETMIACVNAWQISGNDVLSAIGRYGLDFRKGLYDRPGIR